MIGFTSCLLAANAQNHLARIKSVIVQDKSDSRRYKTVVAGAEYERSSFYQWLWSKNYRREWTTPVTFPVTNFDSLRSGIVKFKVGGGLHMQDVLY